MTESQGFTKPSWWQRLWRSPWTYLALWLLSVYWTTTDHGFNLLLDRLVSVYLVCLFWHFANTKWGKP